jgi:amino acid adenylation domain-containing protein
VIGPAEQEVVPMDKVKDLLATLAMRGIRLSAEEGHLECYAPRHALTAELKAEIALHKTELLERLTFLKATSDDAALHALAEDDAVPVDDPTRVPLSVGAQGLYLVQKLDPASTVYNVPVCLKLIGEVDLDLLRRAWNAALDRFPILMGRVVGDRSAPALAIDSGCRTAVVEVVSPATAEHGMLAVLKASAHRPFDLDRGPLQRIELHRCGARASWLLVVVHHIVFDGHSGILLLRTVLDAYRALLSSGRIAQATPAAGFADYAAWERSMLVSAEGAGHLAYWRRQLQSPPPGMQLPIPASEASREPSVAIDPMITLALDPLLSDWIRRYCAGQGAPLSCFFLAAFAQVLHRYTGEDTVGVVMPVSLRNDRRYAEAVGYFVNMVPLLVDCGETGSSFDGLLRQVRRTMLDALYHSAYPFALIQRASQGIDRRGDPAFAIGYAYQDFLDPHEFDRPDGAPGPDAENFPDVHQDEDSELCLQVFDRGDAFVLRISHDPRRYGQAAIARFGEHLCGFLRVLRDRADRPGLGICMLGEDEVVRVLRDFNRTEAARPTATLHALFEASALQHADRIAVVSGSRRLRYRELDEASRHLADALPGLGIAVGDIVGLCVERSIETIVGLLAILRAGAAFLPLDPAYPDDRLASMIEDSGAVAVLTQSALLSRLWRVSGERVRPIAIDALQSGSGSSATTGASSTSMPQSQIDFPAGATACLIYTSGSTGQPKGVAITHDGLVNHNLCARRLYGIGCEDAQLQTSSMSFDLFLEEVFTILNSGAKLVMAPKEEVLALQRLPETIATHGLTVLNVPTALFHAIADSGVDLPAIRCVVVGGEKLDHAKASAFLARHPGVALHNTYGPTETTIISTSALVTQASLQARDFVPIGTPIANTRIYILDQYRNPQPIGVPGELYIAGAGVASGYHRRPELTRERFLDDPFMPGARMYRTGDLARWHDDGTIEYLGRVDAQVKIRGFRVEPGEIEAILHRHPRIEQAVVVAQGEPSALRLVAFFVAAGEGDAPSADELRGFLQTTLPEHMIPAVFVPVPSVPMTPNGKIDRRALERTRAEIAPASERADACTPTERRLVDVWSQVLRQPAAAIGRDDDFFAIGGHSLLATQVVSRVREAFGVELPVRALFEHTRISALAAEIERAQTSDRPVLAPVARTERMPLGHAQERLWFIHRMDPAGIGYNVPGAVRIRAGVDRYRLDLDRLESAFRTVIERHEALRTVFGEIDGRPYQTVLPRIEFALARTDLRALTPEAREASARALCREEAVTPFDLERGPLLRAHAIAIDADECLLMVNMHHIVSDGWSIGLLIEEIGTLLASDDDADASSRLPALPVQYADYCVWQRRCLDDDAGLQRGLAHWTQTLAGAPESLELPTDRPRPAVFDPAGATHGFAIDAETTDALKRIAENERCTLFMVLLAAVDVLLYRWSGQEDLCIGTPIANRSDPAVERLIGMFVNTLAIRTRLHGGMTFADLLAEVRSASLQAYEHQDVPFEKVVEAVRPRRNPAISPIFQVMVMLQNADAGAVEREIQPYPIETGISKFDLSIEFTETSDGLTGGVEYATALFDAERIARMTGHLQRLCSAIVAAPGCRIDDIDFLGEERRRLASFHSGPDLRCDAAEAYAGMAHRWFEAQAARTPTAIAVEHGTDRIDYATLNRRANRIAHGLIAAGIVPDDRVAIHVDRGIDMVIGLLGILKAGAAYVPLEPGYPVARLAFQLEDSAPKALLSGRVHLDGALCAQARELGIAVHALDDDVFDARSERDPQTTVGPRHLAYVIYTSGSTGRPKGVMIEHAGLTNYLRWAVHEYADGGRPCDSIVSSPIAFDATVTSVYLPLLTGGRAVVLASGEELVGLEALLRSGRRWDLLKITPLHWRELGQRLADEGVRCDVGRFVVGGEALSQTTVRLWREVAPGARCINEYGPTETVVGCTIQEIVLGQEADSESDAAEHAAVDVPIGRPIDNTRIYILDAARRLQPIGVPGELYIAGAGLARGYLGRPDLTAERFVDDPFVPGARMYRSGDLARWTSDGILEYLGRIDTQVKIRGFRIELGEIETALARHPAIEHAAVVTQGAAAAKRLVGFFTAKTGQGDAGGAPTQDALKAFLAEQLPEYMVPTALRRLDAIPQTPSGKVDRALLERTEVDAASSGPYIAPRTWIERELVALWSDVLQRPAAGIGVHDDFFELGGHSLLALRIVAGVKRRFGREVPLAALFAAPTIARFADRVGTQDTPEDEILVPIQPEGRAAPIFAIPGAGGNVLSLTELGRAFGPDQPVYGCQAPGLDGHAPPCDDVETTARRNLQALRRRQPVGPYRLIGHSYGGVVAYEMARQLIADGEGVAQLVLLDAVAPQWMHPVSTDAASADVDDGPLDDARLLAEVARAVAMIGGAAATRIAVERHRPDAGEAFDATSVHAALIGQGIEIDRPRFDALLAVLKANLRAYRRYRPLPLPAGAALDARLFRATRDLQPGWPRDYAWGPLLGRAPLVEDLDCDHFSMLGRDHIRAIAQALAREPGAIVATQD